MEPHTRPPASVCVPKAAAFAIGHKVELGRPAQRFVRARNFRVRTHGQIRIGISGWTYAGWRGRFYPKKLAHKKELEFASRAFDTIEINGTHYRLQRPENFRSWRDTTPQGFLFAVKASRYITHMKQLRDVETAMANFFASGILALGEKLGPILWQLPPRMKFDPEKMARFLAILPPDTHSAARLARKHDEILHGRAFTKPEGDRPLRHCFEVRHDSFVTPEFYDMLYQCGCGWVIADTGGRWPRTEDITADFVYVRLHGPKELYASGYDDEALDWWAPRIRAWSKGTRPKDPIQGDPKTFHRAKKRDVYVYFDNDVKARAPGDARRLIERLS